MVPSFHMAQFTSESTAAEVRLMLGFVPDFAIVIQDLQGTNPNIRFWANRTRFATWQAGADDSILMTGSTGVLTLDTSSISAYAGGDEVSATDVTNGLYRDAQGNEPAAGVIATAGLSIPAGDQTNSGKNLVLAFRAANPVV